MKTGITSIKPRKKLPVETEEYTLCRRLEEYVEFALARKCFSDFNFYLELIEHIEGNKNE